MLTAVFAFDEGAKLRRTLGRFPDDRDYDVIVVDDGSTDGSIEDAEQRGFKVLRNARNDGIGAAMRRAIRYARQHDYDVIVMCAGNDKDRPDQIPRLLAPIRNGQCKIVQGSRYMPQGRSGRMPFYRTIATRFVHPWLMTLAARQRFTDSTNGFRAIALSLFDDSRIDIEQSWLSRYELEPYLLYKAVRLGHGVREAPVSKIYPHKKLGYTKMRSFTGWWSIVRPVFLLGLGMRK